MDELKIKTIEINKFRSLKKVKCNASEISVFVGKNDAGKSNILKALNLFFNGETEPGKKINFAEDFNHNSHRQKKADEISIKLTFSLPKTYQRNNGKFLVWEKKWREDGEVNFEQKEDYFYGLEDENKNKKKKKISNKSNVWNLMRRINYVYIPAVRDISYFDYLRIRIYNTMTKVAENSLQKANTTFEQMIATSLKDLVEDTKEKLHENIILSFPKNLANIFEKLDFLSGRYKVSLNKRGDGIKNRYIPLILNFIAENEKKLAGQGTAPYTFIWGYEEPENNMEIQNCIDLCNEFTDYIQKAVSQIFLTTHSPVFYNLKDKQREGVETVVYHVIKTNDESVLNSNTENINTDMGTAALMSEEYKRLEERLKYTQEQIKNIEEILHQEETACLFVEGSTDKMMIEKLLDIFQIPRNFLVISEGKGCGENYVIDMLKAWNLKEKFKERKFRAAGLVDEDAKSHAGEYNSSCKDNEITKCFVLPSSQEVINWKKKNKYQVSAYLETFYSHVLWQKALQKNWLIKKQNTEILNESTAKLYVNGQENLDELLMDIPLFISHKIDDKSKGKFTKMAVRMKDDDLKECFKQIKTILEQISAYLNKKI